MDGASPRAGGWASRHPQVSGALLLLAMHAAFVTVPGALGAPTEWAGLKPEAGTYLIGVTQLFYAVPATLLALKLGHPGVAAGIAKAAVATFLLNLGGCAVFLWQLSKIV